MSNLLFLSRWFPYPPDNGSKIRIFNLLKGLAVHHNVSLITFTEDTDPEAIPSELGAICEQVISVPWLGFNPTSPKAMVGFFSSTPRSLLDKYSIEMEEAIRMLLSKTNIDLVIASQIDMAYYIDSFQEFPSIFEEVEISVLYEQSDQAGSWLRKARHQLTWRKYRSYLRETLQKYDAATVVSELEKTRVKDLSSGQGLIKTIPNFIDINHYSPAENSKETDTIIFTGALSYAPNLEGLIWFLDTVYPQVLEENPNLRLVVTGRKPDINLPLQDKLIMTGYLPDVHSVISQARLSIVPIFTGGGTRLKILESMALRTPVIATTKGAEGLNVIDGENILLADEPAVFARRISDLLSDSQLDKRLREGAFNLIKREYDVKTVLPRFIELVDMVIKPANKISVQA